MWRKALGLLSLLPWIQHKHSRDEECLSQVVSDDPLSHRVWFDRLQCHKSE